MKQVGGECPLQGIMPTGKGTPGQEARVFLAFNVLLPLNKGKKCIYALRESSKAWQVIWVFPDDAQPLFDHNANAPSSHNGSPPPHCNMGLLPHRQGCQLH